MIVANIVEKEPPKPPEKGSIDGRGGAPKEGPFSLAVMRNSGIGVVQVGEHDYPSWDERMFQGAGRRGALTDPGQFMEWLGT